MPVFDKDLLYRNLNDGVIEERFNSFRYNLEKNLSFISRFGGLKRILKFFADRNVIIIGAGPSLDTELEVLRSNHARPDILLLSTDMALKPLYTHGIMPHYVISCETNPVDFFGSLDTERMHLLAFSCMSNINLRKWKGDISFFNWMIDDPLYNSLWERSGRELGALATCSIVTTQAVSFALGCSIRSLMLAGNDLAFKKRYYAGGSLYYTGLFRGYCRLLAGYSGEMNFIRSKREYEIRRGDLLFYSTGQFLAAKVWLEELFSKHHTPVYDCSDPGCSEKYVEKISLNEYFAITGKRSKRKKRRR